MRAIDGVTTLMARTEIRGPIGSVSEYPRAAGGIHRLTMTRWGLHALRLTSLHDQLPSFAFPLMGVAVSASRSAALVGRLGMGRAAVGGVGVGSTFNVGSVHEKVAVSWFVPAAGAAGPAISF
jgi:hypothetical protein